MENRIGHGTPLAIEFKYQKDASMEYLRKAGIGQTELTDSGYCWAASIDMALSAFIPNPQIRENIIRATVASDTLANAFDQKGAMSAQDHIKPLVDSLNQQLNQISQQVRANLILNPSFTDFHTELLKGRVLVFGERYQETGHIMMMEKVYVDGGTYIYVINNPAAPNALEGRSYVDNFQLYGRHMFSDAKLLPFIISIGLENTL